ncbi:putative B3 domain-containing protein Os03g0621600 [Nymphaea colorata]|nr:putative B3 domain-containing protein Os03g0621600 [Nymphaea colorata]
MVRKRCRTGDGQSECRKAVGMYFFKVLIGDFHTKLYIPPAFARLIVDDASDGASLNTSVGCYQNIEVLKDSYSMFFHNGWRAFVEHHSLQIEEFLVFRYDGDMQFDVKIFDRSGCEKICFKPVQMDDKKSISCNLMKSVSRSDGYMCDLEVSRNECHGEVSQDSCRRSRKKCNSSKNFVVKGTDVLDMICRDPLKSKMHSVTAINGSSTSQEAISLEITPPGFMITMSTSSVNKCWVHVPADFAKRGILTTKPPLTLRDASHRSWPVHFMQYPSRATLTKGWSSFVKENHLVVGDICVFKLVTGTDDVLEVSIFRAGSQP